MAPIAIILLSSVINVDAELSAPSVSCNLLGQSPCVGQLARIEVRIENNSTKRMSGLERLEVAIHQLSVTRLGEPVAFNSINEHWELYGQEKGSEIVDRRVYAPGHWAISPVYLDPGECMRLSFLVGYLRPTGSGKVQACFRETGEYTVRVRLRLWHSRAEEVETDLKIVVREPNADEVQAIDWMANDRRRLALVSTRDELDALSFEELAKLDRGKLGSFRRNVELAEVRWLYRGTGLSELSSFDESQERLTEAIEEIVVRAERHGDRAVRVRLARYFSLEPSGSHRALIDAIVGAKVDAAKRREAVDLFTDAIIVTKERRTQIAQLCRRLRSDGDFLSPCFIAREYLARKSNGEFGAEDVVKIGNRECRSSLEWVAVRLRDIRTSHEWRELRVSTRSNCDR